MSGFCNQSASGCFLFAENVFLILISKSSPVFNSLMVRRCYRNGIQCWIQKWSTKTYQA